MQINFNPSQYEPFSGYDLSPAGDYPVIISDVVAERTKDQTGGLLKVEFTVMPGHQFAGRKFFSRLNLWNASPKSAEIAHKQLTSLCYAVGITGQLPDTDQLKNRPMVIGVTNDGTYNNVANFKDAAGIEPGKAGQAGAPSASPQGMPQFGAPPPQQPQQGGFPPQQQFQPQAGGNPFGGPPQQPQNPFGAPQQQQQQPAPQQPAPQQPQQAPWNGAPAQTYQTYQQPQQPAPTPFPGGAPAGFAQPQAQQPFNPANGFVQQQQQPQAPSGWPTA